MSVGSIFSSLFGRFWNVHTFVFCSPSKHEPSSHSCRQINISFLVLSRWITARCRSAFLKCAHSLNEGRNHFYFTYISYLSFLKPVNMMNNRGCMCSHWTRTASLARYVIILSFPSLLPHVWHTPREGVCRHVCLPSTFASGKIVFIWTLCSVRSNVKDVHALLFLYTMLSIVG